MGRPLEVPNPKLTLEINAGNNGWSESHFYNSAVPLDNATLVSKSLALCAKRACALDGVNAKLFESRISLDNVNRDSRPLPLGTVIADPTHGYAALGGPDPSVTSAWAYQSVQLSWQVAMRTTSPTCNPILYLPGMPASTGQYGPFPYNDTPPTVSSYLFLYLTELINGSWGALSRDWLGVSYANSNIITIPASGATPTQLEFTLAAPFPSANTFPVGSYVRLQGATYSTPQRRLRLNGTYTVDKYVPATGLLYVNCPRILVAPDFSAFGGLEVAGPTIATYTSFILRPATHRKRGRPFGGGRGRR